MVILIRGGSIFLFTGLLSVISVPFIYWRLDNDIASARFLTTEEKKQAYERLRANQTGVGSQELKWSHVTEAFLDVKTYLFIGMSLGNNLGAQVVTTFGPLILDGLGFDKYTTSLLNMPLGAIQIMIILIVAYAAIKSKFKSITLLIILCPIIVGIVLLYVIPRNNAHIGPLLLGYYFLAFIFGCNTMIVSWILANTGGQTKKSVMMGLYNGASSAGNIIGPLLFTASEAPTYHQGLRKTLGVYVMIFCVVIIQVGVLFYSTRCRRRNALPTGSRLRSMTTLWRRDMWISMQTTLPRSVAMRLRT